MLDGCNDEQLHSVKATILQYRGGDRERPLKSYDWVGRQISAIGNPQIRWVSGGNTKEEYRYSRIEAISWIAAAYTLLHPVIDKAIWHAKPPKPKAKPAPDPKRVDRNTVSPELQGKKPSRWPIPLTRARPVTRPAALDIGSTQTPRINPAVAQAATGVAGQRSSAKQPGLCPICGRLLPAGRSRHQQCENASVSQPATAHKDGPTTAGARQERQRYRDLVARVEQREAATAGRRSSHTTRAPLRLRLAREAVLVRCQGRCENPHCTGQPDDVTARGEPILEVDHVQPIADCGRDHPVQMVALCPNCHAVKTRGSKKEQLQQSLLDVARKAHHRWTTG
ncbi:HNH endonuclease [Streptantibioticus parmotrematis]|uniref:HNH endonuclease n=1 Tax=Streptantibioticus parmotrematis TaxID=2873249 RepID=UPI00355766A8